MPVNFVEVEEAVKLDGLRMVVVGGIPSAWGEAAKGIFHIKNLDWAAVRIDYKNPLLKEWAGQHSGPIAIYNNEQPLSGWEDILMLAERLSPLPSLLPTEPDERTAALNLARDICCENGLGWWRRLQLIHAGLNNETGFPIAVSQYLGKKYGYSEKAGNEAGARVVSLLQNLSERLHKQHKQGRQHYFGDTLTAVDVYSATCMAFFDPLPAEQCRMDEAARQAFGSLNAETKAALDPILLAHRDAIYKNYLELPLSL